MKAKNLYLLVSLILFLSCKYSPSGSNFIESETEFSDISFDVSITPSRIVEDTLKISEGVQFEYSIDLANKYIHGFEYWVDDDTLKKLWGNNGYSGAEGKLGMNTTVLEDGLHTANFKITTNSGRQNILDQLGGELLEFNYSIQFFVDNSEISPVQITSVEKIDGELVLNWEKSRRQKFKSYYVSYAFVENGINYSGFVRNGVIEDQTITTLADRNYIGGIRNYRIAVNEDYLNGSNISANSTLYAYEDSYPTIVAADTSGGFLTITWRKCDYPKSFSSYSIQASNKVFTFENINDTTYTFSYRATPSEIILKTNGFYTDNTEGQTIDTYNF